MATLCSFATDAEGHVYELPMPQGIPNAESVPSTIGPGPWQIADVGPTEPEADGTRRSTRRIWIRAAG